MNSFRKYYLIIFFIIFVDCVKQYNPPVLQAKNNYLVVDGFINAGTNQTTTITLSRTRSISDSVTATEPELNASIQIVSNDGNVYPLSEQGNGIYQSAALSLDNSKSYQLKIKASNGNNYSSALESCLKPPPVDSLTWKQQNDVYVYLYTHDPENNTRYYKWDYIETWQYNSIYQTIYGVKNNLIYKLDTSNEIDSCWKTDISTNILLGTSVNLSEDVINHAKIAIVPFNDEKIYVRYSILVRQWAITPDAYKYWQIVEKNSQDRGGLFDVQPGQLQGNIFSETDPTEPVIGFINASSETESRLFINHKQVTDWGVGPHGCDIITISQDPNIFNYYDYPDTSYAPYHYVTPSGIALSKTTCLDCRTHDGVNKRPLFW